MSPGEESSAPLSRRRRRQRAEERVRQAGGEGDNTIAVGADADAAETDRRLATILRTENLGPQIVNHAGSTPSLSPPPILEPRPPIYVHIHPRRACWYQEHRAAGTVPHRVSRGQGVASSGEYR